MARTFAAVDLGASGGRVIAGRVDGGTVSLDVVHRFPNAVVDTGGTLRWDFSGLYRQVLAGLERIPEAESIGIATWGVDYGLLDAEGRLLSEPVAYRDGRTAAVIDEVHALIPPPRLYAINGLQFLPFNTLYQLQAEKRGPLWRQAAHVVLLPDLIAYWLTGALGSELTNASTTGLLDVRSRDWSGQILDRLGVDRNLLPPVEPPGTIRGRTKTGTPVVTVGSHDTASAVMGVPAAASSFAYVVSGTWSLVGLELSEPVLTDEARRANFTNEVGVDGRIRFLRNVGGLWLLQECLRAWGRDDLDRLLEAAARLPGGVYIDVDDPAFIPPGRMPERIADAAGKAAMSPEEIVRCVLDSLARGYAATVQRAAELSGRPVEVVHVVGGGSMNTLLCQLTADAVGLPVLAGPVEATALGNVLVQARAAGAMPGSLEELRSRLAACVPLRRVDPR